MRSKKSTSEAMLFAIALAMFALSSTTFAGTPKPRVLRIGLSNVMEEPGSDASIPHGDYFRKGVLLAFEQNSEFFKKKNLKIEFENFDYKSSGVDVIRAANLAAKSDVVAVIGYNYSDHVFLAEPTHGVRAFCGSWSA